MDLQDLENAMEDGRGAARRERAVIQRAETVHWLHSAARAGLREQSVFDLSAAVVARGAGTTRQTVHHYFPSMRDLVFGLADELTVAFQGAGKGLEVEAFDWPYRFADRVAGIALNAPIPNRQVLLVSASQGRGMAAATAETSQESIPALQRRNSVGADRATWMTVTLFRGVLFTWAAEKLSDEELRRSLHDVAERVAAQRRVWAEEDSKGSD